MYDISIYNKSQKLLSVYNGIHTVTYQDILGEKIVVKGDALLTHPFTANHSYQLLSNDGNYCIDSSIIGTFEVHKAK